MNQIKQLVYEKNWNSLIFKFSPREVCFAVNFYEGMHIVKHLFYDDIRDDDKQQYALKLAFEIKNCFQNEWEKDWKNEVFLGGLCAMLCLYGERYQCYKRAYDKLKCPPAELLLLLSDCNFAPPPTPVTDEESEYYLKRSVENSLTCETALAMRSFCKIKKDIFQEEYWDRIYKKLEKDNIHSNQLIPDVHKEYS